METPLTEEEGTWVASLLPMGSVFGPFLFGYLTTRIGKKLTILLIGPLLFIAALLLAFSRTVVLLYIARFIGGVAVGGLFSVFPNYIGEISESHNRGALSSILNVTIGAGMLFSYALGPFTNIKVFNCVLAIFPVIFVVLFLITGTESPYYYVQKGQHELAKAVLQKIRGPNTDVEEELMIIQLKIKEEGNGSFFDIFKSNSLSKAFIVSTGLLVFQQLSGMNAVLFYSQSIFEDADVSLEPKFCSIILGTILFLSNFLIPVTVDRLGRRMNLLISASGMVVAEVVLGLYYYLKDHNKDISSITFLPILSLLIFVIFYTIGFAAVPWIFLSEIFSSNIKSSATSVISTICWVTGFLSTKYFPALVDAVGMGSSFWIFSAVCAVSIPFIQILVLETKGKTLHEIQEALGISTRRS